MLSNDLHTCACQTLCVVVLTHHKSTLCHAQCLCLLSDNLHTCACRNLGVRVLTKHKSTLCRALCLCLRPRAAAAFAIFALFVLPKLKVDPEEYQELLGSGGPAAPARGPAAAALAPASGGRDGAGREGAVQRRRER